jgi:hypothetical protein
MLGPDEANRTIEAIYKELEEITAKPFSDPLTEPARERQTSLLLSSLLTLLIAVAGITISNASVFGVTFTVRNKDVIKWASIEGHDLFPRRLRLQCTS